MSVMLRRENRNKKRIKTRIDDNHMKPVVYKSSGLCNPIPAIPIRCKTVPFAERHHFLSTPILIVPSKKGTMSVDIPINLEPSRYESGHPQQPQENAFLRRSQSIKQRNPKYQDGRIIERSSNPRQPRRRASTVTNALNDCKTTKTTSSKSRENSSDADRPVLRRAHSISFDQRRRKSIHRPPSRRSRSLKQSRRRRSSRRHRQLTKILSYVGSDYLLMERDIWIECIWFRRRNKSCKTYFKSIHTQKCFKRPPSGARTILYLQDCIEDDEVLTDQSEDESSSESIQGEFEDQEESLELKEMTASCCQQEELRSETIKKGKMLRFKKKLRALSNLVSRRRTKKSKRSRRASF